VRALAAIGASALYLTVGRPLLVSWGATQDETSGPFPGEGIVPGGHRTGTMATTIDAPPSAVWPWLAQMGCDRGGWYSWDRLDNGGRPSTERIHPEWQALAVGDRLASTPSGTTWFTVAALEPERVLVLRASLDLRGRPFDPDGPRPRLYNDSLWSFRLTPLPGERTRLAVSGHASARPRVPMRIADVLIWEPAHWLMQTRQFANLRRRAERASAG
jgi:proline iminopeptidase